MKKIIYVHGLGSSGESNTGKYIKEHFNDYDVILPDIPTDPIEASSFVFNLICNEKPYLVIGSSLGAFYVLRTVTCNNTKKLLINPAMKPYDDIKNNIGVGKYKFLNNRKDGSTEYTVDDKFFNNLKKIQMMFECDAESCDYYHNTYSVFGTNDEMFSHIDYFCGLCDAKKMITIPSKHRLTNDDMTVVEKYVKEVIMK